MAQEQVEEAAHARATVVGTGAVGTAVATALLNAGMQVTLWNRSTERTAAAAAHGATPVTDLAEAVGRSPIVLVCLTDHDAVEQVLSGLPQRGPTGAAAVVLTTGTPEEAERTGRLLRSRGLDHVDAGIQTAPEDIGTPQATLLYCGSETAYARHRVTLEALGPVHWLGSDPTAAATWDLALFGLWYDAQVGLLRAFETASAARVSLTGFAEAAARQLGHVVDAAASTASEIEAGDYPRGPASLAEHLPVLRNLRDARSAARLGDGGLAMVTELVEGLVARGGHRLGLTAVLDPRLDRD
jgi:3-hydroxyisobutyrate dehydrogenase-like beta-hydroxyacid dehydrogenase